MVAERHNDNGQNFGENGAAHGNAYAIDIVNFSNRLETLYSHWKKHQNDLWGASNVLAIATPPPSEDLRYLKSSALNIWLLGYEFPDTIMIFTEKRIYFLCSQKKAFLLEVVKKSAKEAVGADVEMQVKPKNEDGTAQMDSILDSIRDHLKESPVVGHLAREAPEGKLLGTWAERLERSKFQVSDITNGLSDLFAVKGDSELMNVKKASYLVASVMKNCVVPKLKNVIVEEKKVTHSSLMDDAEKAIMNPAKAKVKLKAENVDICYPPIFQSGGEFDLKPTACSNDEYLYYDSESVIISALGSRYNSYCSNVVRTFLIDANKTQMKAYEVLLRAQEAAIGALKPGNKSSAVYQAALSVVKRDAPEFAENLTKNAGTGIGLEFRESGLVLNSRNDRVLKAGMVFNLSLGFHNLQAQTNSLKSQNFSMLLADTVIAYERPNVLTSMSSKAVKDVAYSFIVEEPEKLPATLRSDKELSKYERAERATLATQEKLVLAGTKLEPIRLHDLWIRPVFGGCGKKLPGTLKAHVNGFRYATSRQDERVDIMFRNIKHAFFQPAEREMITLLHFHLHNHIMVGTKKTKEVQFYVEVMDVVQSLGGGTAYDPDEIKEEQRERKKKINTNFQSFVNRVMDLWRQPQFKALDLDFEQPNRKGDPTLLAMQQLDSYAGDSSLLVMQQSPEINDVDQSSSIQATPSSESTSWAEVMRRLDRYDKQHRQDMCNIGERLTSIYNRQMMMIDKMDALTVMIVDFTFRLSLGDVRVDPLD